MGKYFRILVFTIVLLNFSQRHTVAQDSTAPVFDVEYNIRYETTTNAETQVSQTVGIINRFLDVIPTNYTLSISQMDIFDAKASMDGDSLETKIEEEGNTNKINIKFAQQAIGEGKKTQFDIKYKTKDIASQVGKIWNINIPKVDMSTSTKVYNVELVVPRIFGPKIFVSPTPVDEEELETITIYRFSKEQLKNIGITASFGEYQLVNFNLKYQLQNPSAFSSNYEIALPPDIKQRQQIIFDKLNPQPESINIDKDGNFIARYKLSSKQLLDVEFSGTAKIYGKQISPQFGGSMEKIPSDLQNTYTKADTFWESNSAEITKIANELKKDQDTVSLNASRAYEFTVRKLKYDFDLGKNSTVERKGALRTLSEPNMAACMEFTDLFIAIVRAMGIPARELNGYAFATENTKAPITVNLRGGDYLHAWPEYYDPIYGWVAVDPTWGNTSGIDYFTKLDTNHFVFAIKGIDSEFPAPAGSYKSDENQKQVDVDFAQNIHRKSEINKLKLTKQLSLNPIKLIARESLYKVENQGNITLYNPNGAEITLLPNASDFIYIQNSKSFISYEDFVGNKSTLDVPRGQNVSVASILNKTNLLTIVGIGAMLVLYTILYVFLVRVTGRRK